MKKTTGILQGLSPWYDLAICRGVLLCPQTLERSAWEVSWRSAGWKTKIWTWRCSNDFGRSRSISSTSLCDKVLVMSRKWKPIYTVIPKRFSTHSLLFFNFLIKKKKWTKPKLSIWSTPVTFLWAWWKTPFTFRFASGTFLSANQ